MRALKHVLAFVAVLLFFGYSLVMLRRVLGVTTPWLALLLMFYFLALAKVAEPLFALRMPAVLQPLRSWELRRLAYRRLAVPAFGTLLRRSPLRYLNSAVYLNRHGRDLRHVVRLAESAEAAHFWAAALLLPFIVFAWLDGQRSASVGLLLAQVLVNVYPVLHLRLVRARLDHVIRRQRSHQTTTASFRGAWPRHPADSLRPLLMPAVRHHPRSRMAPTHPEPSEDQRAIDELVRAFFALFSNRGGVTPNLQGVFDLCVPQAVVSKCVSPLPEVASLESFIAPREALLSNGALTEFCEVETAHRTHIIGNIAQRVSAYSKAGSLNGTPFQTRGAKLFQFIKGPQGWRISAVSWDDEREGLVLDPNASDFFDTSEEKTARSGA